MTRWRCGNFTSFEAAGRDFCTWCRARRCSSSTTATAVIARLRDGAASRDGDRGGVQRAVWTAASRRDFRAN